MCTTSEIEAVFNRYQTSITERMTNKYAERLLDAVIQYTESDECTELSEGGRSKMIAMASEYMDAGYVERFFLNVKLTVELLMADDLLNWQEKGMSEKQLFRKIQKITKQVIFHMLDKFEREGKSIH